MSGKILQPNSNLVLANQLISNNTCPYTNQPMPKSQIPMTHLPSNSMLMWQ